MDHTHARIYNIFPGKGGTGDICVCQGRGRGRNLFSVIFYGNFISVVFRKGGGKCKPLSPTLDLRIHTGYEGLKVESIAGGKTLHY